MKNNINEGSALWVNSEPEQDTMLNLLCEYSDKIVRETRSYVAEDSEWLNTKQAAQYMKVSVAEVHNLTSSGKLPYYKRGRANRYLRSELRDFLISNPRGQRIYDQV